MAEIPMRIRFLPPEIKTERDLKAVQRLGNELREQDAADRKRELARVEQRALNIEQAERARRAKPEIERRREAIERVAAQFAQQTGKSRDDVRRDVARAAEIGDRQRADARRRGRR